MSFIKKVGAFLKKQALVLLAISLTLCLISGFCASLVKTDGYSIEVINETKTLALVEVSGTLKFSYTIYRPKTATKDNPAPLIVSNHGYMNTKEMQAPIALELARRGFVVITPDWASHGHTAVTTALPAFSSSGGVIAIVEYGATLEYVDASKIGVTGHSLGGDNSSYTAEYYGKKGKEAAAAYLTSIGKTTDTATPSELAAARAADDKANKISALLPVASQPTSIFGGALKIVGTKTTFGVVVTLYDETTWGQAGKYTGYNATLTQPDLVGKNPNKYEWTGSQYLSSPNAAKLIKNIYPAFATNLRHTVPIEGEAGYDATLPIPANNPMIEVPVQPVKANTYYTASGEMTVQPTAANPLTEAARVFYPINFAHATAYYNVTSIGYINDFFYASLGTPANASVLSSSNQTWVIYELFTLLGLVGIMMFVVAFAGVILRIPFFAKIKQQKVVLADGVTTVSKPLTRSDLDANLPELKGWKRQVSFWLTLVVSTLISGFSMRYFTGLIRGHGWGNELFPASPYFPQAFNNAILVWALMTGFISLILFGIQWFFVGRKAGERPFDKLGSGNVGRSLLAAIFVLATAYVVLLINEGIFGTDFRWYIVAFKTFDTSIIMTIIRYFLVFSVFYAMNTFINVNQRFKNVPEWASTLITALFNVLGLGIVYMIQYFTAYSTGGVYYWSSNLINYSPLILILAAASILQRRLYLKSGNVWFAAFITSLLFTMMVVANINHATYIFL